MQVFPILPNHHDIVFGLKCDHEVENLWGLFGLHCYIGLDPLASSALSLRPHYQQMALDMLFVMYYPC